MAKPHKTNMAKPLWTQNNKNSLCHSMAQTNGLILLACVGFHNHSLSFLVCTVDSIGSGRVCVSINVVVVCKACLFCNFKLFKNSGIMLQNYLGSLTVLVCLECHHWWVAKGGWRQLTSGQALATSVCHDCNKWFHLSKWVTSSVSFCFICWQVCHWQNSALSPAAKSWAENFMKTFKFCLFLPFQQFGAVFLWEWQWRLITLVGGCERGSFLQGGCMNMLFAPRQWSGNRRKEDKPTTLIQPQWFWICTVIGGDWLHT